MDGAKSTISTSADSCSFLYNITYCTFDLKSSEKNLKGHYVVLVKKFKLKVLTFTVQKY